MIGAFGRRNKVIIIVYIFVSVFQDLTLGNLAFSSVSNWEYIIQHRGTFWYMLWTLT